MLKVCVVARSSNPDRCSDIHCCPVDIPEIHGGRAFGGDGPNCLSLTGYLVTAQNHIVFRLVVHQSGNAVRLVVVVACSVACSAVGVDMEQMVLIVLAEGMS